MPPDARAAAATRAAGNFPCRRCGYDLAGLSPAMSCPECGGRVSRMRHRTLLSASPAYIRTLATGSLLLMLGVAAYGAITLVQFVMYGVLPAVGLEPTHNDWFWEVPMSILYIAAAAITLLGWWMLAARDPGAVRDVSHRRLRTVVRGAAIACLLLTTVSFLVRHSYLIGLPTFIAHAVGFVAVMLLLRRIGAAAPRARLARWFTWNLRLGVLLYACEFTRYTAAMLDWYGISTALQFLIYDPTCCGLPLEFARLLWYALFFLLMSRFRHILLLRILPAASPTGTTPN